MLQGWSSDGARDSGLPLSGRDPGIATVECWDSGVMAVKGSRLSTSLSNIDDHNDVMRC